MSRQKKYVYKFSFPDGMVYIGITNDPETRWQYNGTLYNPQAVGKAIKKYGWENIKREVVFYDPENEQAVLDEEKRLIEKYKDRCYNHLDNPNWGYEKPNNRYGRRGGYVHVWTIDGDTKPAQEWCKIYSRDLSNTLAKMKKYGLSPLEALTVPIVPADKKADALGYWKGCGFSLGNDKKSYVTPIEDWPVEFPKAYGLREEQNAANGVTFQEAISEICKRENTTRVRLSKNTKKNPATIRRAANTGTATVDTLIEIAKAAGYSVALVKRGKEPKDAIVLRN